MFGVMLSYFYHFHAERLRSFVMNKSRLLLLTVLAFAVLVFAFRIDQSTFFQIFGFTILYVLFGALLLLSLYLWHVPLMVVLFEKVLNPNPTPARYFIGLTMYISLSLFLGIVMAKVIEQPVLRLRDRLFPSRSGTARLAPRPTQAIEPASAKAEAVLSFPAQIETTASEPS